MFVRLVTHDLNASVRATAPALDVTPVMCFAAETWLRMINCQVHLAVKPMRAGRERKCLWMPGAARICSASHQLAGRAAAALRWLPEEQRGDSGACPGAGRLCCLQHRCRLTPGMTLPMPLCVTALFTSEPATTLFSTVQSAAGCGSSA